MADNWIKDGMAEPVAIFAVSRYQKAERLLSAAVDLLAGSDDDEAKEFVRLYKLEYGEP